MIESFEKILYNIIESIILAHGIQMIENMIK